MSGTTTCPGADQIDRLAAGQETSPEIAEHVRACEACRAQVREARLDAEFLGRVRELTCADLGPQGAPRLRGYRTIGVVSSGGQGVIYRAVQESTSRIVAIKTLMDGRTASARQRARAEREAEIAARLRHPNIVTVFESRTLVDGRIAVVMEFVDGAPLDAWVPPRGQDVLRKMLGVFVTVCNAVHHAHLNGVIHRDLKPDNILVTAEGRPVVVDFGIAKIGGLPATLTGEFAGTPAYSSPEQVCGQPDEVDALTDVYSLGVILYRLICRKMPYELEGTIFDMARTIVDRDPTPPRRHDASIHPDLEAIVLRAIRKEKNRRYQSAASLGRDVERFLGGRPVEARSGSGWYLLRKAVSVNRGRLAWVAAAALVLLTAVAAVVFSLASVAASEQEAAMQSQLARAENVRARAVTELLREALPLADRQRPEVSRAIDLGLSHLFARLETGALADDPALEQALRRLWGSVYTGFGSKRATGQVAYAELSLRNGLVRLRMQHEGDHPEIAGTLHELAGLLLLRDRAAEAEQHCRQAVAMRRSLLGPRHQDTLQSSGLMARILHVRGAHREADRTADDVLAVARELPEADADLLVATMLALKARICLDASDAPSSAAFLREALVRRLRRMPATEPEIFSLLDACAEAMSEHPGGTLSELMNSVWSTGKGDVADRIRADLALLASSDVPPASPSGPPERTNALGRLVALQAALLGPDDLSLVGTLMTQARTATWEAATETRRSAALRAAEILSDTFGPTDLTVLLPLQEAAAAAVSSGQPELAADTAGRISAIWEAVPLRARDLGLAANARRLEAFYLSLCGRNDDALKVYDRAIDQLRTAFGDRHHVVALAMSGKAYCLAAVGRIDQADAMSADAIEMAQGNPATSGDQLAHMRFVRGHVLTKCKRWEDAAGYLQRSWDEFYSHPTAIVQWRQQLVLDMAACCQGRGDATGELAWRARTNGSAAE